MKTRILLAASLGMAVLMIVPVSVEAYPRSGDRRYRPSPPPRSHYYDRGYDRGYAPGYDPGYAPYDAGPRSRQAESLVRGYVGIGGAAGWVGGDTGVRSFGGSMAGGLDLFGGVELGRWVALELNWRYLSLRDDSYVRDSLNELMVGAKVFVLPRSFWVRPYAALGVGLAFLSPLSRDYRRPVGPGLELGAGLDVPIGRHFAIGAKMSWRPIFLDDSDFGAPRGAGRSDLHDLSLSLRLQVMF